MYQKSVSSVTDAGCSTPSIITIGCPERRVLAIVASKKPKLPVGPETVKLRRPFAESKTRPETEELLTTCICNPIVVAVGNTVVVEMTVLVSVTVVPAVVVLCVVVTEHDTGAGPDGWREKSTTTTPPSGTVMFWA